MIRIAEAEDLRPIYHYQMQFSSPYFFPVGYDPWRTSFMDDVDGEGRTLFKELDVKAAWENGELIGFIQYGKTAFGFDDSGELSSNVSYCVIRNLYFQKDRTDAGHLLLKEALDFFPSTDRVYAFFHYFGMSCFARHGKLFEQHDHVAALLKQYGFVIEHENVYYSSLLKGANAPQITITPQALTSGGQQYLDFSLLGDSVGGCEIHFPDSKTAYLRWIYVNENLTGRGIGTKCMDALKHWLLQKGVARFDTDTALTNAVAQHFYEKNGFTREGITRSYYR